MAYEPYLIADFATGLEERFQPWLKPDDAQQQLFDGYVYRGVMSKRNGYKYFATGNKGGAPYAESRIVHNIPSETIGAGTGSKLVFNYTTANPQIRRGTTVISYTIGGTPYTATDNGLGVITGTDINSALTASFINYVTGAIQITFTVAPDNATNITIDYDFHPGLPVMMVATFVSNTNTKVSIVADEMYVNQYDPTTNLYYDISSATPYTGTQFNFFSWVNYKDGNDNPRLIFTNNVDEVQYYAPQLTPVIGDYVSYTGFFMNTSSSSPVAVTSLLALLTFEMKDRLLLLRTTENGVVYPQRIRVSGTGASSDDFRTSATGAGFYDIPDGTWIQGAAFNRDDLIIFTEASTWVLKYTGNDTDPFVLNKIDESRGSDAAYAAITYLNRTTAVSKRGLIISDGYRVEREDEGLPDFSYNEINGNNFALCFAGTVDADRDHYLIYPSNAKSDSEVYSDRIITTNYEEDNFSIYRLPLSCMGTFISSSDVTWNDLLIYPNWDSFAAVYSNWNAFSFTAGTPISLGGGHFGEIWQLNVTESEDNPVNIRNIVKTSATTVQITTDWNNFSDQVGINTLNADTIYITGVSGMDEINEQQYPIVQGSVINNNTFSLTTPPNTSWASFSSTSLGIAIRVIPFSATMKKFNPYINADKKVRCGWLYMYVNSTPTLLRRYIPIVEATNANPCVITTGVSHNLFNNANITITDVEGMTQLNGNAYIITVLSPTTFSLNGVDSTAYGAYTSGGYANVAEKAKMSIDILRDDNDAPSFTELDVDRENPYQGSCTNLSFETGSKKWYKVFINQTGRFIQFRFRNVQAGANISVQAIMPGFQAVGRIL